MTKKFCDLCKKEVTKENDFQGITVEKYLPINEENRYVVRKTAKISIHVVISTQYQEDIDMKGDFCRYCLLDALQELDKRPKAAVTQRTNTDF